MYIKGAKPIRTYSRPKKASVYDDLEPLTKRRRVDSEGITQEVDEDCLASSSPHRSVDIFSDEPTVSSPPSSPVPYNASPPPRVRRPMFSGFGKPKPAIATKKPLSERSHNIQSTPEQSAKKRRLVQMQLDLVTESTRICKECGMNYIPSHAEDAALHSKYHLKTVGGVDISKALSKRLQACQVWTGSDRSFIAVVSKKDTFALRMKASEVLASVNTELGAVSIDDQMLWGGYASSAQDIDQDRFKDPSACERFKMYLYVRGTKCIGACLAERIQEAFPVLGKDDATEQSDTDTQSSSISIGNTAQPALLGISRVWTSKMLRKKGIATELLNSARHNFIYGITIEKSNMAFSQPTESGGLLARKWFGRAYGWPVYVD